MKNLRETLFGLFLLSAVTYSAVIGWWLIYPYEPIKVHALKVLNSGLKAGEVLQYQIDYEKKSALCGVLSRKLVNDYKIDLSDVSASSSVGKDSDIVRIKIPSFAEPGKYYLWWSVTYKVNPIRHVTVTAKSNTFEVVK